MTTTLAALALLFAAAADGPVVTPKDGSGDDDKKEEAFVDDSAAPAQQVEAFKLFTGTWRCDGKANTELAVDVPTRLTISFSTPLTRWLTVKMDEAKSKQNPHAVTSQEVWGYSQVLGGFVRNGADNQGGFYDGTSAGWIGDRFFWTVDTVKNGKKVKLKDIFVKSADGKSVTVERSIDPSGSGDAFRVFYEGTCKR